MRLALDWRSIVAARAHFGFKHNVTFVASASKTAEDEASGHCELAVVLALNKVICVRVVRRLPSPPRALFSNEREREMSQSYETIYADRVSVPVTRIPRHIELLTHFAGVRAFRFPPPYWIE